MKKKSIITLIIILAIGFATVSTTLVLNGVVGIKTKNEDFNIIFTKAKLNDINRKDFIEPNERKTITFETNKLTKINETAVLDYEVTNTSRIYNANVSIVCNMVTEDDTVIESHEYISMSYEPKNMIINAGHSENGKITAKLTKGSTEDQSIKVKCTLTADATNRDSLGDEYVPPFTNAGTMIDANFSQIDYHDDTRGAFWDYKNDITRVVFENKLNTHETTEELTFDVTAEGSTAPVMSYLVPNEDDNTKYTLYISSNGGVKANTSCAYLFWNFNNLKSIDGMEYFDTSNATSMEAMFQRCGKLETASIDYLDTSKVTNMSHMFYACKKLKKLYLNNFDTSKVTDMSAMFSMFNNGNDLLDLDMSNFDLSSLENINYMFQSSGNLNNVIFPETEAPNLVNAEGVFQGTSEPIKRVIMNNVSLPNLTNVSSLFHESSIENVELENFNIPKVTSFYHLFAFCTKMQSVNLTGLVTGDLTSLEYMFYACEPMKEVDVSMLKTEHVVNFNYMFIRCFNLEIIDLSSFNTPSLESAYSMFMNCLKLKEIRLTNFDFTVTNDLSVFGLRGSNVYVDLSNAKIDYTKVYSNMQDWESVKKIKVKDQEMIDFFKSYSRENRFFNDIEYVF